MIRFLRRVVVTLALSLGLLAINSQSTLGRVVDRYHYAPASSTTNVTTPAPNNDNTTSASLNQVNFPPPYAGAHFSSLGVSDTVFLVHASGGSTEYYLTETVFNDSGIDWNAFHLQLGLGIGDMFTFGPVAIPELALPRFDFPSSDPAPTASLLTTSMNVGYQLDWTGGVVPSGATLNLTFSIDVPDDQLNNYSQFTLRQIPQAVPEPATAILLSLGGLAVGCHRQRPVRKSSERSSVAESRQFSVRQFRAWPEQRNSRVDVV